MLLYSENILPNEICICARKNNEVDEIKKALNASNIKYLDLSSLKQNLNAVNVSTFHNIKGHEFKIVFVKGMSDNTIPFKHSNYSNFTNKEKAIYDQQERSLYYVVFSRAIKSVIITGIGEKSIWIDI